MLELDADRMTANLAPLRQALADPPVDQFGAIDALIDRAIAAYEADRTSTTERESSD